MTDDNDDADDEDDDDDDVLSVAVSSRSRWPSDPHHQSGLQTLQVPWNVSWWSLVFPLYIVYIQTIYTSCIAVFVQGDLWWMAANTYGLSCGWALCQITSLSAEHRNNHLPLHTGKSNWELCYTAAVGHSHSHTGKTHCHLVTCRY